VPAHGPGPKAPSIHDGQAVLQGVRALCLRANDTELVSGGADGQLLVWDVSTRAGAGAGSADLSRLLKAIPVSVSGFSSPLLASFSELVDTVVKSVTNCNWCLTSVGLAALFKMSGAECVAL
jgi:hypothetical protein